MEASNLVDQAILGCHLADGVVICIITSVGDDFV